MHKLLNYGQAKNKNSFCDGRVQDSAAVGV